MKREMSMLHRNTVQLTMSWSKIVWSSLASSSSHLSSVMSFGQTLNKGDTIQNKYLFGYLEGSMQGTGPTAEADNSGRF